VSSKGTSSWLKFCATDTGADDASKWEVALRLYKMLECCAIHSSAFQANGFSFKSDPAQRSVEKFRV